MGETGQEKQAYLDRLGEELTRQGFTVRVVGSNTTRPYLKVANSQTPTLNERVRASQADDGAWCYWWPWGQPIGSADDLEGVTGKIAAVLRSVEGEA